MVPEGAPLPRLDDAEWLIRPQTQAVFRAIEAGGYSARAVGGVVRNALLGEAVADVDIATTAPPGEVMRLAAAAGLRGVATGLEHGTVTVVADHIPFEVTTLREDIETFGRHARVAFTEDWAADARRRDFTINALYCDASGAVHDPLGGYHDVLARRVRFIGDAGERIREDYLRILRFFRLTAVHAAGPPDQEGLSAAVRERAGLAKLSGERVRQELMRLLSAPRAPEVVRIMRDHGLLTAVLPVAPRPEMMRRLADIERALALQGDPVLRLAALTVEIIEDAERLRTRLRLSAAEFEKLARTVEAPPALKPGMDERKAEALLYRLGAEVMREFLLLNWARSAVDPGHPSGPALMRLPDSWRRPVFPVRGSDVLAAGVAPGKRVGEILRTLEDWWISEGFPDNDQQLHARLAALAKVD